MVACCVGGWQDCVWSWQPPQHKNDQTAAATARHPASGAANVQARAPAADPCLRDRRDGGRAVECTAHAAKDAGCLDVGERVAGAAAARAGGHGRVATAAEVVQPPGGQGCQRRHGRLRAHAHGIRPCRSRRRKRVVAGAARAATRREAVRRSGVLVAALAANASAARTTSALIEGPTDQPGCRVTPAHDVHRAATGYAKRG